MAAVVRLNTMAADKNFSATFRYLLQGGVRGVEGQFAKHGGRRKIKQDGGVQNIFGNVSIPSPGRRRGRGGSIC